MRAAASPVSPGSLVDGKYRVEAILGVGGMGVVVRALHEQLGRTVAIKFLLPEMLRSAGVVQRFEREARATARLKNEHIIDVIDVGRLPTGEPFIVMEFLEGSDLASYLHAKKRLAVDESIEILLQICDGVAEAHANGIVHRDLKPQNIFLTRRRDGRQLVKVLDFGISKVAGDVGGGLTSTSDMLGSPYYMSPEQLLSTRDVGPSADVWALGVILYQLLAGQVPFAGDTLARVCVQICNEMHVPLSRLRGDVPPWLVGVVEACLQKDPSKRIQTVDALASALRARGSLPTQQGGATALGHAATAFTPDGGIMALRASSPPAPAARVSDPYAKVASSGVIPGVPPTIVQPAPSVMMPPGTSTNVGWGHTNIGTSVPMRSPRGLYVAVAVCALFALGGVGLAVHRFVFETPATVAATPAPAPPPPASAIPEATASAAAPSSTPAAASSAAAPSPPAASAAATPTKATATPTSTHAKPPSTTSRPPATTTTAKPQHGDDLPSLRK